MNAKKENYWFMFRLLLLVNVVLITIIALAHSGLKTGTQNQEPCGKSQKINTEVLNYITVKLM